MSQDTDTSELTSVREQLQIMDTGDGRPEMWFAEIGVVPWTQLTIEEWLLPSKLSGGRIALRIDLDAIEVTEWATVESDTIRMVVEGEGEITGPAVRSVVADGLQQQREGFASVRPVLRAETPLAEAESHD